MYTNNYNQQYPRTPQTGYGWQQPTSLGLKGRPVSSLDEVRAASIDFDGSIFFFPDMANKKIYTKQINMDGTVALNMYELKEFPTEQPVVNSMYITREEFEQAITQLRTMFQAPKKEEVKTFN